MGKINVSKLIKKDSRLLNKIPNKGGFHIGKKPRENKSTDDYLLELEQEILIGKSNILTALNKESIGTRVLLPSIGTVPGQAVISLDGVCDIVSSGTGKRTNNPDDYIIRVHREKVSMYLKRNFAEVCKAVSVVVYTLDAYLNDPDITEDEFTELCCSNYTHILVAVLASSSEKSPLTPTRFVHNLAGGNNEAIKWTADEIRSKAVEIKAYYNNISVVAD
jgi:hypothetical protein